MAPLTHDFDEVPGVEGNFGRGLAWAILLSSPIFAAIAVVAWLLVLR